MAMYHKKEGPWHIIETWEKKTTLCGIERKPHTRAVLYDFFAPLTPDVGVCEDCMTSEDLPFILLRTKA